MANYLKESNEITQRAELHRKIWAIAENGYNLSVSTYIEKEDTREVIDIKVLNGEIEETVVKINELRASINEIIKKLDK